MKADELFRRLENIKTYEDERHKIAEYLVRKLGVNNSAYIRYYIMTKYRKIYVIQSYRKFFRSNKISPDDAYVYVLVGEIYSSASYYFPFLENIDLILYAYLSKLGFESNCCYPIVPATGLKYVSIVDKFSETDRIVVEVVDINNVTINIHLPALIHGDAENKHIDDEVIKVTSQLDSQKFFAGYNFNEAWRVANRYYEDHDKSLANEVTAINTDYNRIFQPYRTEYDLNTKRIIASFMRKLF